VRDNIPGQIQDLGGFVVTRTLEGAAYRNAIANKIVEEALELRKAKDQQERYNEMADLLEIIETYRTVWGMSNIDLKEVRMRRGIIRGLFIRGLKLLFAFGGAKS
jgi:predicted house-cleaning noncanonical NTP pyrophosphatase (MazG superfamily)